MIEAQTPQPLKDCAETGQALVLAGAKLAELIRRAPLTTYYRAAESLGIFQTTLTDARIQAQQQGLIRHDFSSIHDRLTEIGQLELDKALPIGVYATAMGALIAHLPE